MDDLNIEIIKSDSPGVGKTEYIKDKIDGNYCWFPLGNIDKEFLTIISNILNKKKKRKISIIFELFQNFEENSFLLIRNFLFKFLILKRYEAFNYVEKDNVDVYIEISSDYIDYDKDYKILKLFKTKEYKFKNISNFYDENPIKQNVHGFLKICKFFDYLNRLKTGEINQQSSYYYLQNIKDYYKMIKYLFCDRNKLFNELVMEYFVNKFSSEKLMPNYGQIHMFVNSLYDLILHFEKSEEMKPENILKNESFKNIRKQIIESYIDLIVNFSSLSYESILENQEIASKNQKDIGEKISDELKIKLIKQLNTKRIISYNVIKPSIVLFNDIPKEEKSLNKCSILTVCEEDNEEYKLLNELYTNYYQQGPYLKRISELERSDFKHELFSICLCSKVMNLLMIIL